MEDGRTELRNYGVTDIRNYGRWKMEGRNKGFTENLGVEGKGVRVVSDCLIRLLGHFLVMPLATSENLERSAS